MASETTSADGQGQRIVTPAFCLLFVASFATTCAYYLTMTLMARYALETFHCTQPAAGFAASVFMVGGVIGRIVCMQIPPQHMRFWSIASMAITLASVLAYFIASIAYPVLLFVRVLHGLAFGVSGTLVPALAVEKLPRYRMGEGTGYFMLSVTLGTALGPMIGLLSSGGFDWTIVFAVTSAIAGIGLVATILSPTRQDSADCTGPEKTPRQKRPLSLDNLVEPASWKLTLFMFILAIGYMPINTFVGNYAAELGLSQVAPFVFLVYAACLLITRPFAGKIMDTRGTDIVLAPSILSMIVGLLICAAAQNAVMLLLVGVFMATGFGTAITVAQAAAAKLAGPGNASKAIATLFLFADAGAAVGPVVMGTIADAAGFRVMYAACAAVACLAFAYYWFIGRKVGKGQKG